MKEIKKQIIAPIIIICFVYLINLFFVGTNYNIWLVVEKGKTFIFEIIMVFLIYGILFGIVKKGKNALTILGVAFLILSIINQVKMAFTGEPVLLSDALYLENTGELMGIVEGEILSTIRLYMVPLTIEIALFVIFIAIGRFLNKNIEIKSKKIRISLIFVPLLMLVLLILPIGPINKFMLNSFFDLNKRKDYKGYTSIAHYYMDFGVIGGMYGQLLENRITIPDNYDENEIDIELSKVEENEEKILGKPNIIVVFSESFWDIDQLEEVNFNTKVTR